MSLAQYIPVLAAAVAVTAAVSDLQERRIPNRLTYPAMLAGVIVQAAVHGWTGLMVGIGGGLFLGAIFFLFYVVRAMGGGDVKLAIALGCITGSASAQVVYATALAGGALAIIFLLWRGRMQIIWNAFSVVAFHARHGLRPHPLANLDNPAAPRLPYGLAFAAGTLYWAVSANVWR